MNIRDIEAAVSAIEDGYIQEAGKAIGGQERPERSLSYRLQRSFPRRMRIAAACLARLQYLCHS